MHKLTFALVGLAIAPALHAGALDLSLSDETFAASYSSPMITHGAGLDVGWLHHVDNGDVATAGLVVEQSAGHNDSYALGAQAVAILNDVNDAYAVALGGRFNAGLPFDTKIRVGGHVWYAPKVTSFNGADRYQDYGVHLGYQALQRGEVYVGYRFTKVGYENDPDVSPSDNVQIGMNLTF